MNLNAPTMQKDCYKEYHYRAAHPEVDFSYANFTNRSGRLSNVPEGAEVGWLGLNFYLKEYLIRDWNVSFFSRPKEDAVRNHKRIMSAILGYPVMTSYLENLHDLGYMPLRIKALPEGTLVPYQVAPMTYTNTVAGFEWLPGMLETIISTVVWPMSTSFTTAIAYQQVAREFFEKTGKPLEALPFAIHDFSFRGMFGPEAAAMSGFAHLAGGSCGTDTIPSVLFAEKFYGADVDTELVGASVDATEHSVTCNWEEEGEEAFLNYLFDYVTVTGILSFVSDTWDFWEFVNVTLRGMKDKVMSREGTFVVRPDSGDPVKILTGYLHSGRVYESSLMTGGYTENNMEVVNIQGTFYRYDYNDRSEYRKVDMDSPISEVEVKGLVQLLWEIFGGTETELGYKMLDSHIGCIYGDSITLERQREIYQRLMDKGFCPEPVLGVGSYSYQYVTRDTHGSAIKATSIVKRGKVTGIAKEPKTDSTKKSARGLLRVERVDGELVMYDQQTLEEEAQGLLEIVFEDGVLLIDPTLQEIRDRVLEQII